MQIGGKGDVRDERDDRNGKSNVVAGTTAYDIAASHLAQAYGGKRIPPATLDRRTAVVIGKLKLKFIYCLKVQL